MDCTGGMVVKVDGDGNGVGGEMVVLIVVVV